MGGRPLWGLLLFFVLGCAPKAGKIQVQIPWPDSSGNYVIQNVQLETLKDPYVLKGSAAKIYIDDPVTIRGYLGEVAKPNLTQKSNGTYVPTDASSLVAVTAYAHFEAIQKLDQRVGVSAGINWPRQVGIDIAMLGAQGIDHNNARYFHGIDVIAIMPYMQADLEMAINGGILAHEHFHAHFYFHIVKPVKEFLSRRNDNDDFEEDIPERRLILEDSSRDSDENFLLRYNAEVLMAWDEGLADFWGYVYSKQADFVSRTLASEKHCRNLNQGWKPLPSVVQYRNGYAGADSWGCAGQAKIYSVGANIARYLIYLSDEYQRIHNATLEDFAREIVGRLPALGSALQVRATKEWLPPGWLFYELFKDQPQLLERVCDDFQKFLAAEKNAEVARRLCVGN